MRAQAKFLIHAVNLLAVAWACTFSVFDAAAQSAVGAFHQSGEWSTHAHDAQHSGVLLFAQNADAPIYIPVAKTRIPAAPVTCERICGST